MAGSGFLVSNMYGGTLENRLCPAGVKTPAPGAILLASYRGQGATPTRYSGSSWGFFMGLEV